MIPLAIHSAYSLLQGTALPAELCRHARQLGYRRLALTDTDNLYGLWPFLAACREEGLTPIVGAEITDPAGPDRAVCLVADRTGFAGLCRLISRRRLERGFVLARDLPAHARGLVVLTASAPLLTGWHEKGVRVAAAMFRRPLPAGHPLRRAAVRLGAPLVAVPDSFFLRPRDVTLHRLLAAIGRGTVLSRLSPADTAPPDAWLAGPGEYARRFAACPAALHATHLLAETLAFTGPESGIILPPWQGTDGRDAAAALRDAAYEGARTRYGNDLPEPVVDRLEHELRIIGRMGFAAYFLIVREIVAQSPRTCGRGSGAASLVAYALGITNVCPVKHNLYFERFLNPGRQDPPDIDVDFAWDERDQVLAGVLDRYRGQAAMVSSHVLFQPRMAVRETARVFGLTEREIGTVTRHLAGDRGAWPEIDPAALRRRHPGGEELDLAPPWPRILDLAGRIKGLPRHLSVHPGGVVITPGSIDQYAPLEPAPKGVPILQWDKEGVEAAGLVKIDLLGNRSLAVIRDAVANLRQNGVPFKEGGWEPEDDPATQAAVRQGRTMGCFYIESPAMRQLQQKARVGDFAHLVIHTSIIRPAANDCIQAYLHRLHGGDWTPIHPLLDDLLDETFGIMVYQEDVSRAAVALAGFSHAEADGLRKVLSKKNPGRRLADYQARFAHGAARRGLAPSQIEAVWRMMLSFDGYSFCKPHSASYARVSFQAAYLKVHYPAEFMAGVLSNGGGFYSPCAYVSEARRLGLAILPPDVNQSQDRWTGEGKALRVGLSAVKGLSAETRARILRERRGRPFAGLADTWERIRPGEDEARALIHAGALDAFSPDGSRSALLWQTAARQRAAAAPCGALFPEPSPPLPPLPPEDTHARLRHEFDVLGFLIRHHPLALSANRLTPLSRARAADLPRLVGRQVRLAGWPVTAKTVRTRQGDPMEFVTFEDETGLVETTFFPRAFRRFRHLLDHGRPYVLAGRVEADWGAVSLNVAHVRLLEG